jgi:hypothetical protein
VSSGWPREQEEKGKSVGLGEKESWVSVCEGGARLLLWWKGTAGMENE